MRQSEMIFGDNILFHTEPPKQLEQIIPYGIQYFTKSPWNHIEKYLGNGMSIGALSEGIKIHTLREAISPYDSVRIVRYHGDGVGGAGYTQAQCQAIMQRALYYKDAPYAYAQIPMLMLLCELNNTSWEEKIMILAFEHIENIIETDVMAFIKKAKVTADQFFGNLKTTSDKMLICSELVLRLDTEDGIPIRILNDASRGQYYKAEATGDILDKYRQTNKDELVNPLIEDFVTPRDMAMTPDYDLIDDGLELDV